LIPSAQMQTKKKKEGERERGETNVLFHSSLNMPKTIDD